MLRDSPQKRQRRCASRLSRGSLIEQWPTLPLERYALGGPDHDNFCYVMEFESEALCSIRGGSARKHAIYRKASGDWYYDDSYPSVEAAWEAVRGAFVEAFRLARAGDFEAVDNLRPIRSAAALRTKALYVYFPDEMLPINSSAHLAHFIAVLGGSVGQRGTVEANRTLLQLVRGRPEFEGWMPHEISTFLYEWADPRKARLVVKVAPGERAAYWDECRENGYICIGWDELGDLSRFASQEEFRKAFDDQFSEEYHGNKSKLSVKANEVWTFRELEPGDTVIANRGTNQVVGIGTVIEPGYLWHPEREVYKNTVSVQWTDTTERTLDPPVTSWFGSTVAKVPGDLYQRITAAGTIDGGPPVSRPAVSPEPVLPEIRSGLQRRGQVVLYGPPGTGKTYAARRFAVWWLLSRAGAPEASWILGDRAALADHERTLSTVRTRRRPPTQHDHAFTPRTRMRTSWRATSRDRPRAGVGSSSSCATGSSSASAEPPRMTRVPTSCSSTRSTGAMSRRSSASSSPSSSSTNAGSASSCPTAARRSPSRRTCSSSER